MYTRAHTHTQTQHKCTLIPGLGGCRVQSAGLASIRALGASIPVQVRPALLLTHTHAHTQTHLGGYLHTQQTRSRKRDGDLHDAVVAAISICMCQFIVYASSACLMRALTLYISRSLPSKYNDRRGRHRYLNQRLQVPCWLYGS